MWEDPQNWEYFMGEERPRHRLKNVYWKKKWHLSGMKEGKVQRSGHGVSGNRTDRGKGQVQRLGEPEEPWEDTHSQHGNISLV